ncbi:MAG: hypothetical protein M5R40_04840 [Anaerolineae bacterium]|nr:hypothetical protein [Anaerolineae bacterium]
MSIVGRVGAICLLLLVARIQIPAVEAQESEPGYKLIILTGTGLVRFNTTDGTDEPIPSALDSMPSWDGKLSPARRFLIYWDGNQEEQVPENGVWLIELEYPDSAFHITLPPQARILNQRSYMLSGLLGERFALVKAGIHAKDKYHKQLLPVVTFSWLVDTEEKTATPWYWDCNEIVYSEETRAFALYCPIAGFAEDGTQKSEILLTSDGPVETQFRSYDTLFRSDDDDLVFMWWEFSPQMEQVAIGEYSGGGTGQSVSVFNANEAAMKENLLSLDVNFVDQFVWSPSENTLRYPTPVPGPEILAHT